MAFDVVHWYIGYYFIIKTVPDTDDSFTEENLVLSQVKSWSLFVEFEGMASGLVFDYVLNIQIRY